MRRGGREPGHHCSVVGFTKVGEYSVFFFFFFFLVVEFEASESRSRGTAKSAGAQNVRAPRRSERRRR